MSRHWTAEQVTFLCKFYVSQGSTFCARVLNCSLDRIMHKASALGLRRRQALLPAVAERLHELHAQGWLDTEIARELGVSQQCVSLWRQRLGLAAQYNTRAGHRQPERVRARISKRVREAHVRLNREDRPNGGVAREMAFARQTRALGWPEAARPSEARLLELLLDGPKTLPELCAARVLSPQGTRKALHRLIERHAVRRLHRAVYALTARVLRRRVPAEHAWKDGSPRTGKIVTEK